MSLSSSLIIVRFQNIKVNKSRFFIFYKRFVTLCKISLFIYSYYLSYLFLKFRLDLEIHQNPFSFDNLFTVHVVLG